MNAAPQLLNTSGYEMVFDEVNHIYTVNGKIWPSVTKQLEELQISCYDFCDEEAMFRGSQVHKATEYFDQNRMDESTIPDDWLGYYQAYTQFRADKPWEIIALEQKALNPILQYTGTLDRVFFDGHRYILLDIKTGGLAEWVKYQLAAYACFYVNPCAFTRVSLQLKANGKYSLQTYNDTADIMDWQTMARFHQIMKEMGRL
ncbi:hypothetical protein D4R42_05225 [bacterium]|nr:MAG: hypothetical protein D4R42_05225 [bacterium]